jgi:hypothetical protein
MSPVKTLLSWRSEMWQYSSRFAPCSIAHPPRWQHTRYMVYISVTQDQNATELGNLGFCSTKVSFCTTNG